MKRILFAALLAAVGFGSAYAGTQYYTIGGNPQVYCSTVGNASCAFYPEQLYNIDHQPVSAPLEELYTN